MRQFPKLHPIAWLFVGCAALTFCRVVNTSGGTGTQEGLCAQEVCTIPELTAILVEADALDDEQAGFYYQDALMELEAMCQEHPQNLVLTASKRAYDHPDSQQYTILNILENAVTKAEREPKPAVCEPLLVIPDGGF